ncbi:hypothetical protein CBR_g36304 [Chara braunii]|uniref:DUF659 domain-containing protein n=1 Tax=Chara braunii TaxID=69332 RepID=A0A388LKC6_CHABU|nr:hypothetical protein CBR_g36304 [Chara braunii]|eukprot:GBG82774.1 hypothetical protein CBR_g36304 [Chara braunii]
MLQMDGWSDRRNKPQLNVMVSSPVGTVFWKSVCMEGREKNSKAYFKLLDGVIQEIGEGSIVGVVMDIARVCAKAGKMVEAKYPDIFSVGCTAHAFDLALEDMYKCMDWLKAVVDKGNQVGKFFTNVDKVRVIYNRIASAQLKRSTVTRFATNFEMLQSPKAGRNPLELCVCNAAWVEKLVRGEQVAAFNTVTHIIMDTNGFWKAVDKAIAVMEPVVKLLRLVDGPGATMSKVYFGMEAVVARMRTLDCLSEAEKTDVEKILMDRWAFMTSELHCATAFLDPKYRTHTVAEEDAPPNKKRGRPPLSAVKKAAKAAACAEAVKAAAAEARRPARKRTAEVIEDNEENPCLSRKKQSSSSSSSSSEDSAPQNIEEEEEMSQQSDDSGEADGDESEEDPSQAQSHGKEQSREEDE